MKAYIQHGSGTAGPFCTESVDCKIKRLWWQDRGLQYTATGYGKRIPTQYMVKYEGKWRRVYCCVYSNAGALYIGNLSDGLLINVE